MKSKLNNVNGISVGVEGRKSYVIGDIHGCFNTLTELLKSEGIDLFNIPEEIILFSVGDLNDKGPYNKEVLDWAIVQSRKKRLFVVDSNHGRRLARRIVDECKPGGSVEDTYLELLSKDPENINTYSRYLSSLPAFIKFHENGNNYVISHAAMAERFLEQKILSFRERNFCLGGEVTRWNSDYNLITGHQYVTSPYVVVSEKNSGKHIKIDTGVDSGGKLSMYIPSEDRFISIGRSKLDK